MQKVELAAMDLDGTLLLNVSFLSILSKRGCLAKIAGQPLTIYEIYLSLSQVSSKSGSQGHGFFSQSSLLLPLRVRGPHCASYSFFSALNLSIYLLYNSRASASSGCVSKNSLISSIPNWAEDNLSNSFFFIPCLASSL